MGTTKLFIRSILTLGLVAVVSSYGLAAEGNRAVPDETVLNRASHIMGARVASPQGETLGKVHDIVLTPDLNGISYVAVSRGGFLGIGRTLHAIPWSTLSPGLNKTYVAPITVAQFTQSRGFSPSNWPSSAEDVWPAARVDRGEAPAYSTRAAAYSGSVHERRFSRIKGSNVNGADGKKIGNVRDLVIAMESGRIAYTVVSHGGMLGLGRKLAAVPQDAVTLEPALHVARVNADKAILQANSFPSNRWPDLAGPAYSQELARAYGVEPSGTVLGYVPPATPPTAAPAEEPAAPAELMALGAFDTSESRTIDGMVTEVSKSQAAGGMEVVWLHVKTTDGQLVNVQVGPRDYLSKQGFIIVNGDRVRLTGWDARVTGAPGAEPVFVVADISQNGQTLELRGRNGEPLWPSHPGSAEEPNNSRDL